MAAEIKLFARRICPAVARFAAQKKCFSGIAPRRLIQPAQCASLIKHDHENLFQTSSKTFLGPLRPDESPKLLQSYPRNSYRELGSLRPNKSPKLLKNYHTNSVWELGPLKPDKSPKLLQHNPTNLFRQLGPIRPDKSPKLLQNNTNTANFLKGLPKTFIFRRKKIEEPDEDRKKKKKRVPKLILIQNPFTWLMIKIDFSVLRNIWDPGFEEKEFKIGTKQAISKITNVISDGQYSELNGLLTKAARLSLMRELDRNWSEKQRSLLALNSDDIQISSPRKVYFIRIADKKYCDVDMAFLALKWAPINSIEALIFTEIFARFHREYTPHCIPEWTIAYFKVTRFEVLRRKAK